jgi:putative intracellular protease/amidase
MMAKNKRIGILLPNHFDGSQFKVIQDCIKGAGGSPVVIGSSKSKNIVDKQGEITLDVDRDADDVSANDIAALIVLDSSTPEEVKASRSNLNLILKLYEQRNTIGTLDRGVELLVAALGPRLNSHKVTGPGDSKPYLESVGATVLDKDIVRDSNVITARSSNDAAQFCRVVMESIGLTGGIAA